MGDFEGTSSGLGGESLFVNLFKNEDSEPADVVLTSNTPGDMVAIDLENSEALLQPEPRCLHWAQSGCRVGGVCDWIAEAFVLKLEGTVWLAPTQCFRAQIGNEYVSTHPILYL